eukprot:293649-Chlamydomonas_euryale.AAC.1
MQQLNTCHSERCPIATCARMQLAPAGTQLAPAGAQLAPAGAQRAPAGTQLAPAGTQRAPAGTQRAPAGTQCAPAGTQHIAGQKKHQGGAESSLAVHPGPTQAMEQAWRLRPHLASRATASRLPVVGLGQQPTAHAHEARTTCQAAASQSAASNLYMIMYIYNPRMSSSNFILRHLCMVPWKRYIVP